MAIFERRAWGKVVLDDTQALKVTFEGTQNVRGHTEYVIKVQRGPDPANSWRVCKRYNDFVSLHSAVVQTAGFPVLLPPKKLLGNMDRSFIAERQSALEAYVNVLLMNPILASSLGVRRFLDPESYVLSLQEQAMQHVAMAMRGEVNYELLKPLPDVGWRLRKHYFQVRSRGNPRVEMALQWVEYGPDKSLDERDVTAVLKCLINASYPHIHALEYAQCSDSGSFVIRLFHPDGTLRDHLYGTKPKIAFLKKYGSPKQSRPLAIEDVQIYGRQILNALAFLKDRDIPYGHLHTGNVLINHGQVELLDVENGILGLPSYYRPFFVQHKKINTLEAVDVYCFGHVLYEMSLGRPLHESVCDAAPPSCPAAIWDVLKLILSSESVRSGLPSIADLQQHAFFRAVHDPSPRGVNLKMSSDLRKALRDAGASIELRLRNEQKQVRTQKKIAKVQEMLTSEDEIKKRKQRLKEERKANHANNKAGKKSPPRSDSPTSTSTATSAGTVTPPLPAMKSVMNVLPATVTVENETLGRSALLSSICSFDKSNLRAGVEKNGST